MFNENLQIHTHEPRHVGAEHRRFQALKTRIRPISEMKMLISKFDPSAFGAGDEWPVKPYAHTHRTRSPCPFADYEWLLEITPISMLAAC